MEGRVGYVKLETVRRESGVGGGGEEEEQGLLRGLWAPWTWEACMAKFVERNMVFGVRGEQRGKLRGLLGGWEEGAWRCIHSPRVWEDKGAGGRGKGTIHVPNACAM